MSFFFQAEDGIRDTSVTGVQTCALPISGCETAALRARRPRDGDAPGRAKARPGGARRLELPLLRGPARALRARTRDEGERAEIGRASCRGRGELSGRSRGAVTEGWSAQC